ncbi:MAG: hypothetical protein JNJ83_05295 [Verrucomicrobiaceae bacterium]|nr:hypothetical protein [Verrucomicrobiaceae bacterium]
MPFDPTKPANNAPLSSAEMRSQLTGLNDNIQAVVNAAISNTSANSNSVSTLNQGADSSYNQTQMQDVLNKLDELINVLRR